MYLIKFNFTNKNLLPRWVPEKTRKTDESLDAYRALSLKASGDPDDFWRAKIGAHRDGRVDTGLTPGQREMVTAGYLHQTMSHLGHGLVDIHWFYHQRSGKIGKYVLVLAYEENLPCARLRADQVKDLQWFQSQVWNFCHLWVNPEAGNITINFTNRMPDGEADLKIGYCDKTKTVAFLPTRKKTEVSKGERKKFLKPKEKSLKAPIQVPELAPA